MTQTAEPPTTPATAKTTYHVLELHDASTYKLVSENIAAGNAEAAIRAHVAKNGGPAVPVSYIAVPSRSWKPVTVSVETKTVLKLG